MSVQQMHNAPTCETACQLERESVYSRSSCCWGLRCANVCLLLFFVITVGIIVVFGDHLRWQFTFLHVAKQLYASNHVVVACKQAHMHAHHSQKHINPQQQE